MPAVNSGEVWMTDFGIAAKVRPDLLAQRQNANAGANFINYYQGASL